MIILDAYGEISELERFRGSSDNFLTIFGQLH